MLGMLQVLYDSAQDRRVCTRAMILAHHAFLPGTIIFSAAHHHQSASFQTPQDCALCNCAGQPSPETISSKASNPLPISSSQNRHGPKLRARPTPQAKKRDVPPPHASPKRVPFAPLPLPPKQSTQQYKAGRHLLLCLPAPTQPNQPRLFVYTPLVPASSTQARKQS